MGKMFNAELQLKLRFIRSSKKPKNSKMENSTFYSFFCNLIVRRNKRKKRLARIGKMMTKMDMTRTTIDNTFTQKGNSLGT